MLLTILIVVSAIAFLFYGTLFFANSGMKQEFERYGLDRFRKLVGLLQLLGGLGLLVGLILATGIGYILRRPGFTDGNWFWRKIKNERRLFTVVTVFYFYVIEWLYLLCCCIPLNIVAIFYSN